MSISKRTLETLIDLVEIKLSCIEVYDREDARELANLERCLGEQEHHDRRQRGRPSGGLPAGHRQAQPRRGVIELF